MPLKLSCPQGHEFMVASNRAGTTVRCPQCPEKIVVPPVARQIRQVSDTPSTRQPAPAASPPRNRPPELPARKAGAQDPATDKTSADKSSAEKQSPKSAAENNPAAKERFKKSVGPEDKNAASKKTANEKSTDKKSTSKKSGGKSADGKPGGAGRPSTAAARTVTASGKQAKHTSRSRQPSEEAAATAQTDLKPENKKDSRPKPPALQHRAGKTPSQTQAATQPSAQPPTQPDAQAASAPPPVTPPPKQQPPSRSTASRPQQPAQPQQPAAAKATPPPAPQPGQPPEETLEPRGYEHTPEHRMWAYCLGAAMAALGVFSMSPAVWEIADFFQHESPTPVAHWAYAAILIGLIQLFYAVYVIQFADFSSVWVIAIVSLISATGYAVLVGMVLLGARDVLAGLHLTEGMRTQALLWCFSHLSITGTLAYFAGAAGLRWGREFQLATASTSHGSHA